MRITAPAPDERVPLSIIDLSDADRYRADCQHAVWQTLRAEAPVWWQECPDGTGFWSFSKYEDCDRMLRDHRAFSSEDGTILASVGVGDPAGGQAITLMDPPEHGRVRGPAMRRLGKSAIRGCAEQVSERVARLFEPVLDGGEHDFAVVARELPMAMFGELLGVPEELYSPIAFWASASIAPEDPEYLTGSSVAESMRNAHHELFAHFSEALRHRRAHPGDDLLTVLASIEIDGKRLSDWQVLLNCYSFILGAHSTTPHVAAHTLRELTQRPELWRRLTESCDLVPALVEEGTRWTSPTHHLVRRATEDVVVRGEKIAAGDWVCGWVASANRDEEVFDQPYEFRCDRAPNPHLGFGVGAHFCIGTHLSRAALVALFEHVVSRLEAVELSGEVTHLRSNWINGLTHMPVTTKPGQRP